MLLALLGACSVGTLLSSEGREPLRAAWYAASEEAPTLLLLSNSSLLCELPESDDPAEIEAVLARQQAGLTREGAKLLYLELDAAQGDLVGSYDVAPDGEDASVRSMRAVWWQVVEAKVEAREGIVVAYEPGGELGDVEYVPRVGDPATLEILAEDGLVSGRFDLGSLDISGRFEATACAPDASLFATLGF